jgi:hypothetical protein
LRVPAHTAYVLPDHHGAGGERRAGGKQQEQGTGEIHGRIDADSVRVILTNAHLSS